MNKHIIWLILALSLAGYATPLFSSFEPPLAPSDYRLLNLMGR